MRPRWKGKRRVYMAYRTFVSYETSRMASSTNGRMLSRKGTSVAAPSLMVRSIAALTADADVGRLGSMYARSRYTKYAGATYM